jgi:hypothetical protein
MAAAFTGLQIRVYCPCLLAELWMTPVCVFFFFWFLCFPLPVPLFPPFACTAAIPIGLGASFPSIVRFDLYISGSPVHVRLIDPSRRLSHPHCHPAAAQRSVVLSLEPGANSQLLGCSDVLIAVPYLCLLDLIRTARHQQIYLTVLSPCKAIY